MGKAEQIVAMAAAAADQLDAAIREHERDEHDDEVCVSSRMLAVFSFARTLGMTSEYGSEFGRLLRLAEGVDSAMEAFRKFTGEES